MTATSLEEVPADLRRQFESLPSKLFPDGPDAPPGITFVMRDAAGQQRTYHSLDEMPPQVREAFERFRRKHDA